MEVPLAEVAWFTIIIHAEPSFRAFRGKTFNSAIRCMHSMLTVRPAPRVGPQCLTQCPLLVSFPVWQARQAMPAMPAPTPPKTIQITDNESKGCREAPWTKFRVQVSYIHMCCKTSYIHIHIYYMYIYCQYDRVHPCRPGKRSGLQMGCGYDHKGP